MNKLIAIVVCIACFACTAFGTEENNVVQLAVDSNEFQPLTEKRVLFAQRLGYFSDEEGRLLGKRRRRRFGVKKAVKKGVKAVTGAVKGPLKKLSKSAFKEVKDAYSTVKSELNFKGSFIPRKFLDVGDKMIFKKLVQGAGSMVNYFENQFVDDLEWFGDEMGKVFDVMCNTVAYAAVVTSCSYLLNAATCTALGGIAPASWCVPLKIWDTILQAVGAAVFRTIITCSTYHAFKKLMCKGKANSLGVHFASVLLGDPFTVVCDISFGCSCGNCPFTCDYGESLICDPDTYKKALKQFGEVIDSL